MFTTPNIDLPSGALLLEVGLLQDWEQGRRQHSGAAQTLIRIALSRPDVIMEVMAL